MKRIIKNASIILMVFAVNTIQAQMSFLTSDRFILNRPLNHIWRQTNLILTTRSLITNSVNAICIPALN